MEAIAIKQDAANLADEQNGSVISLAFRRASVHCPSCAFPENVADFKSQLRDYTELRQAEHRARKSYWCSFYRYGTLYQRYTSPAILGCRADELRRRLEKIWPCQDCITRYNPTGKIKYPRFSAPKQKAFIE
jgi:hypothetical protein